MHARPSPLAPMLLAIGAFACFAIGDATVRSMAGGWAGTAIALTRYIIATGLLFVFVAMREGRAGFVLTAPLIQVGRGVAIATCGTLFWISLGYMPLADATAIEFTNPVWTVLLSAALLGERIGLRQGLYVMLGFAGVLIVLQPNVAAFGFGALVPLGAAFALSILMVLNRLLAGRGSAMGNQFWLAAIAMLYLIPVTIAGHLSGVERLAVTMPTAGILLRCAVLAIAGTIGHLMLYRATTHASAATLAPMGYSQILFAVLAGWLFFQSPPKPSMLLGGAIIIGAGYMLIRANIRIAKVIGETGAAAD